ncbi:hypothetical protein [Tenacibaculum piscium]|uniref:hypothetical protein n=1 Tax=Tenacibaculum piscium TaxID=1458515 RepID=UPI0023B998EE|nr:hypothetical protein [Tenacibaculum piscium]
MLNQIKTFRENQAKIPLYKSLTSMRSLAVSIQSYNLFYGIKQASFFYILFEYLIPNDYLRVIPSLFFGYFVAKAMLNIAVNIPEKKEWVIVSIAFFDFLMLCVILDIMHKTDWIEIINLLIFCGFVTYIGYWLNQVFVLKVEKTEKTESEQNRTDAEQIITELKQVQTEKTESEQNRTDAEQIITELKQVQTEKTESEQNRTDTEQIRTELKQVKTEKTESEQNRTDAEQIIIGNQISLLDSIDTTCPYCSSIWKNKKGRDRHKGSCEMNPKNIKK